MRVMPIFAAFFVLVIMFFSALGFAADFSADMVSTTREGTFPAKVFVSGDTIRMEMAGAVTISRIDKKVAYILMPDQKMYMEQPLTMRPETSVVEKIEGEIERTLQGAESVNGMHTTKYLVTVEASGKRESVYQWIDESIHFPVKTAAVDGTWSSEYKNITLGTQKEDLFEIPAGYQKMSFGME